MIKNARLLLKIVKNDGFDRVKIEDKNTSKNKIIRFLKDIIKGDIKNNNKDKECSVRLKRNGKDLNYAKKVKI